MADIDEEDPFMIHQPEVEDCDPVLELISGDSGDVEDEQQLYEGSEDSDSSAESQPEIDAADLQDMRALEKVFLEKGLKFRMVDRIGEGTFSTVYKAEDLHYDYYQNDWDIQQSNRSRWSSLLPSSPTSRRKTSHSRRQRNKSRFVAIKKIYVTSSPMRIQNELELLHTLRNCDAICPLITAFRHLDQVVAILPHFSHQDFRSLYKEMDSQEIKSYFRSLFSGLAAVHRQGIIHRDIKPTNFLYNRNRRKGVLVDFGLAEREGTDSSHCICQDGQQVRTAKVKASRTYGQGPAGGYPKNDQRASRRANRAGTRGFRAPEVLLKCTAQSTKIDIWSAGVILLTILAKRFPFFHSADDIEAMIEIASIFGQRKMKACAWLHGAAFECTLPTIGEKGFSLEHVVHWSLNSSNIDEAEELSPEVKDCVRFLERCLELDPRKRISAKQALASDFLSEEARRELEVDELQMAD